MSVPVHSLWHVDVSSVILGRQLCVVYYTATCLDFFSWILDDMCDSRGHGGSPTTAS